MCSDWFSRSKRREVVVIRPVVNYDVGREAGQRRKKEKGSALITRVGII
jgi:hypothetical protein